MFYKVFVVANNTERVYNVHANNRTEAVQKAINEELGVNKTPRYLIEVKGAYKEDKFDQMNEREYENFKYEVFNF